MAVKELYEQITSRLIEKGLTVSTMESCTAGLIASLLTNIEGSSKILKGAFVTYSNEAKIQQGVPEKTIAKYGVYSDETALQMAKACRKTYKADIGIGITGTASNKDSKNPDSKPNMVHYAFVCKGRLMYGHFMTDDIPDRFLWKMQVAEHIGEQLLSMIEEDVYE